MNDTNKTAHTPGPWVARMVDSQEWHIDSRHYAQTGAGTWSGLAVAYGCDDMPDEGARVAEANARLIAAAPELLEALDLLLHDRTPWTVSCARAAIAKATGAPA